MPLTRIDHLLVLTDDIDATRDFYRDVLGLEVGDRPPLAFPGYWLYADGLPCVHVAERDAYTAHAEQAGIPAPRGAVDHVAFDASDYEEAVARAERSGADVVRHDVPAAHLRRVFVEDPNGVKIEINVREG
jgi:catechol 2,3-dioxygenase-like lactoylglutathione lyase family enzyme